MIHSERKEITENLLIHPAKGILPVPLFGTSLALAAAGYRALSRDRDSLTLRSEGYVFLIG